MSLAGNDHNLHILQQKFELCVRCKKCCRKKTDISYELHTITHQCLKNILLVRQKVSNKQWKQVAPQPEFPKPSKYEVCWYYAEGNGCTVHGRKCTYARSKEEAEVWNFIKKEGLELSQLINLCSKDSISPSRQKTQDLKGIISSFQGTFVELCKICFNGSPRKISSKEKSTQCAQSGHTWNPLLVFCQTDKQNRVVYEQIRPLPKHKVKQRKYCRYVVNGEPCWHGAKRCWFAHSEVEMKVWDLESSGTDRSCLTCTLQTLQTHKAGDRSEATSQQPQQYHCHVCKCQLPNHEEFMNHCFTMKHKKRIFKDLAFPWKYRDPPLASKTFRLCERMATCEYGDSCTEAHSVEELDEWQERHKATRKKIQAVKEQGLLSYQDSLLEEYRHAENKEEIMMETLPDISVSCNSRLDIIIRQEKIAHAWIFKIKSKTALELVALLRQDRGAKFTLGYNQELSYSSGDWFVVRDTSSTDKVYEIKVFFTSDRPGIYEQWLVFDFDMRPVLLQKLKVRVGEQLPPHPESSQNHSGTQQNTDNRTPTPESTQHSDQVSGMWNEMTHLDIVPYLQRSEVEQEHLRRYRYAERHQLDTTNRGTNWVNEQNYRAKMHSFLYQEEMVQNQLISRLNLQANLSFNKLIAGSFELRCAIPGTLLGSLSVSRTLTPDTPEGYLLKRQVSSVLVGLPKTEGGLQRVYEATVLIIGETELHLQLSNRCCTELNLQQGQTLGMEVQFQVDRMLFCEMHKAVDFLPDLRRVLPDLGHSMVPVPIKSSPGELNQKQQAAMDFILGISDQGSNLAPLLIYGPFGTGKTLTLAKITLALAERPQNKILICTHTNSSADLYVKDHFHSNVTTAHHPARPLRIKAKEIPLRTTDEITLQYCHLSKDGMCFEFPDKNTLDAARIIITTTGVARLFRNLHLPADYFSHILIDEASQMLECEALMALGLAGEKTKVVLAGDHMQMGPKLFSVEEDKRSDYTLLNRLFHYYQAENTATAKISRIIFNENYRSTKEIVDFVSTHFYVGKKDVIKAKGNVLPHPDQKALLFYHVQGECLLDKRSLTYMNAAQIQSVVDVVLKVLQEWPDEWLPKDPASVCVLSQGSQVLEIRQRLKRHQLHAVTVENAENVQGKQFRVIIITTVHTKESLKVNEQSSLEFFNDMRLLNTCMTRAQSQVIVVGDATALCCSHFGKCWRLWRSYIKHCIDTESVYPEDFTIDYLDQELLEISNIIQSEEDDGSDTESSSSEMLDINEDPILKELLDESNDVQIKLTEDGLFPVFNTDSLDNNVLRSVKHKDHPTLQPQTMGHNTSTVYTCKLTMDRFDSGYSVPIDNPTLKIVIKGKRNMGRSFSGDVVLVEILTSDTCPPKGKVVDVLKHAAKSKEFVCMIDNNDDQVMMPIDQSIPKLYTPFCKDKPYHVAIRNPEKWMPERFIRINEETRRNCLFVVKFLKWREGFYYPLGIVVNVLPKATSLEDGLKVLNIEYELKRNVPVSVQSEIVKIKDVSLLTEGYEDFRTLMTFTIDPEDSKDLDDAISVRDLGQHYEIGVHIADVASFVTKDSNLDQYARQYGTTYYVSEAEPTYMFPKKLSTNVFSLLPHHDRRCISLMTTVDKQTHHICNRTFFRSVICSKRKLSYEEAEDILITSGSEFKFDTLKGCLAIASNFAVVHRKHRKQEDWCYNAPDEDEVIGRRRAHILVEELMIMFNHTVADRLLFDKKARHLTPLRCQDRPNINELSPFLNGNASLLPMSIHLSYQLASLGVIPTDNMGQERPQSDSQSFPVLTSLLNKLEKAAEDQDIYRIIDLVATDDIHPHLLPLLINFKRLFQKAQVLRASSTHLSRIGHYDLELDSYTWASSPIRRYLDVIVQRLLHSVLDDTDIKYTLHEIDLFCDEFAQKIRHQTVCEKKSYALSLASKLSTQNARKVAYIVEIAPTGNNFRISFPLNKTSIQEMVSIMYRDLQLVDQPKYDEDSESMLLRWVRRVYSFSNPNIHSELKQQNTNSVITHVPSESWKGLVAAIREEDWHLMFEQINSTLPFRQPAIKSTHILEATSKLQTSNLKEEHYVELTLKMKQGSIIEVQLGTDTVRGFLVPAVQLLIVNPKFEICMEHTKNPIMCFSKYALCSTKKSYKTYMEYQKIWKPLCEMESASSAVAENESIVIEDATLMWDTTKKDLNGSFHLPLDKKEQWAIEGNLRNCFLCIRLRIMQKDLNLEDSLANSEDVNLMDESGLIWTAHGVVTKVSDEDESKKMTYMEISFRVNHMPNSKIPKTIFGNSARFTLELIAKLLPDVRKENAIDNLTKANHLVKAIATGPHISNNRSKMQMQEPARFDIENHKSFEFPELNNSQNKAIREALNNKFTLIQGPPGTGKTVVGVHIVYWFFKENEKELLPHKPTGEDAKKTCILYCGPSNKSVDVVAGQLLKLQKILKPLRVYSDQMEILEFPYPGSNLRLSRHSRRVEKPNTELRSITLHHRIRMDSNPYSHQIRAFDSKIKRNEDLTDEEIKSYKECLRKARKHELLQHDVILCTCTAAPHPLLAKTLNIHQIIIDECAMATEPEAFIPLVTHKPKRIVLIGDHKQLQPVVSCELADKLGMGTSLFERYMKKALMLDTQYRMQEDICAFPSQEFYENKLKTGIRYRPSVFLNGSQKPTSIIFGHVEGKEISLVVSTERGNENSKANIEEAKEVVRIARELKQSKIQAKDIAILTPYNAQVAKINELLSQYGLKNITVNTIMKSQGSEWQYVILSTVRSCPNSDIETEPTKGWMRKKLGFVIDPHQVNVGITRAQVGLCIIGNKDLLQCSYLWRKLLHHYQQKNCVVVPAWDILITH